MNAIFLQMLPLLVFLIVDMIFTNTVVSIISAVVFAIVQMAVTIAKTGKPDWLVLVDVFLIAGLGAVSIFHDNDFFFKMKPAIIEVVMVALIVGLIVSPDPFLHKYISRFMPRDRAIAPEMIPHMKKMLWGLGIYTLFHAGAVWFSAMYASRKVWALVSGPGYFILFIPVVVLMILKRRRVNQAVGAYASTFREVNRMPQDNSTILGRDEEVNYAHLSPMQSDGEFAAAIIEYEVDSV